MLPGELVRIIRRRRGLSQERLARRVGTSQSAISRLESDALSPTVETVELVLRAMGYRLEMAAVPLEPGPDKLHRREFAALSPAERLRRAITWNRMAGRLAAAGRAARGA